MTFLWVRCDVMTLRPLATLCHCYNKHKMVDGDNVVHLRVDFFFIIAFGRNIELSVKSKYVSSYTVNSKIFREGLFSRNSGMPSFVKMKSLQNGEITLSFTDKGKSCHCREFFCRKNVF